MISLKFRGFGAAMLLLGVPFAVSAQDDVSHTQCSPDERVCFTLTTAEQAPVWSVTRDGKPVIAPSRLGFMLRGAG